MPDASHPQPTETDSLTVGQILSLLRKDAWKVFAVTTVVTMLSIGYSYLLPETWKAAIHVVPTEIPHSEQLGALAEVLSKKAGSGSANIDMFSALLVSRPVLLQLLQSEIPKPLPGKDSVYSVQTLLKIDTTDPGTIFYAADGLANDIKFTQQQNSLSNIVEVSLTANSPWLAKAMLSNLLIIGQASLFDITRSRYETVIHRLEKADSVALELSKQASNAYTKFLVDNRNSNQPEMLQRGDRLRREQEIRDQTYMMVRRELETNRLEIEKIMPPVVAIDSAFVPPLRESPKRKQIIIAGFLLSILSSSAGFLGLRMYTGKKA